MPTTTTNYGTRTEFADDSNLNSLAASAACGLGPVDNSSAGLAGADAFLVDFSITLAASGVSSTGILTFYLIQSAQSTTTGFTDGISPTGTSVAGSIKNAKPVAIYNAIANSQVVEDTFRLPVPDPSKYWSLVASNGSGAALAGSGNSVFFTPITYVTV
jgi:hypothetical protein